MLFLRPSRAYTRGMDDITNLTPILWNAPYKPYHLKSVRYDHYDYKLPKERAYYCNICGRTVAYTTSKTGKRFLCDATKREVGSYSRYGRRRGSVTLRRYYPNLWHSKTCKPHGGEGIHPLVRHYIARVESLRAVQRAEEQAVADEREHWQAVADDLLAGTLRDEERGL